MAREIDFSLAPTADEMARAGDSMSVIGLQVAFRSLEAARSHCKTGSSITWDDVKWLSSYVLVAGYMMGVRNERKRRRERKQKDNI